MPGQAPCWKGRPGPCRGDASDDLGPCFRACGARPSAGFVIRAGMALRGKARDRRFYRRDALCGSAWYGLPDALAFHPHPMRRRTAGWPTGHMSRSSASPPFGRAEPSPPRDSWSELGWPCGERPERTRSAVFSEGRGLRVREYGPDANRGMSSRPTSWREAGGEIVAMLALCPPYGRAEPAPPRDS